MRPGTVLLVAVFILLAVGLRAEQQAPLTGRFAFTIEITQPKPGQLQCLAKLADAGTGVSLFEPVATLRTDGKPARMASTISDANGPVALELVVSSDGRTVASVMTAKRGDAVLFSAASTVAISAP